MSDDESKQKVAGRAPAVKAGGMRIVQHKTTHSERAPHSEPVEIIGLNQNNPLDSAVVSSSPNTKGSSVEQHHAAHAPKPPVVVQHKPQNNIQQPRK